MCPRLKQFLAEMGKHNPEINEVFSRLLANPLQSEQILDDLAKKDQCVGRRN